MNQYTEAAALSHHFPTSALSALTGDTLTDAARDLNVVSVCLGCGTVVVAPDAVSAVHFRASDFDFSCCPDSDDVRY